MYVKSFIVGGLIGAAGIGLLFASILVMDVLCHTWVDFGTHLIKLPKWEQRKDGDESSDGIKSVVSIFKYKNQSPKIVICRRTLTVPEIKTIYTTNLKYFKLLEENRKNEKTVTSVETIRWHGEEFLALKYQEVIGNVLYNVVEYDHYNPATATLIMWTFLEEGDPDPLAYKCMKSVQFK